ncbi:STAS domain-containing protein [Streptomyces sp. NPDC004065]|uniref:STAS domain-containing protein n=1 Tax=Streptomyces sp. NPDC004065 TaxID=3364689 RepID=UPI00384DB265
MTTPVLSCPTPLVLQPQPPVPHSWPCAPHLSITLTPGPRPHHGLVCRLRGELDLATGPAVQAALDFCLEAGSGVTVDASGLSFVDAAGLRALVHAQERAERRGRRLSITPVSDALRTVVSLTSHTHRLSQCTQGGPARRPVVIPGGRHRAH